MPDTRSSSLEQDAREGESPVERVGSIPIRGVLHESGCLGMQPKMGGKFHLKLNMGTRPIANKYREGKMKSTLKRELKGREAVKKEPFEASNGVGRFSLSGPILPGVVTVQSVQHWEKSRVTGVLFFAPRQHEFDRLEKGEGKVALELRFWGVTVSHLASGGLDSGKLDMQAIGRVRLMLLPLVGICLKNTCQSVIIVMTYGRPTHPAFRMLTK